MSSIVVYSKPGCVYCDKVKLLLEEINAPHTVVMLNPESEDYASKCAALKSSTNQNTFPFVYVGDTFIGGYHELVRSYTSCNLHELCSKIGITIQYEF